MRNAILMIFFSLTGIIAHTQPLWECDDSVFFAIGGSFYINRTDPMDNTVSLEALPLPNFGDINAIAYRRADNCIYGVDNNIAALRRVFRLSPSGSYEIIRIIPDYDGGLPAGTMSFDDKYLILVSAGDVIHVNVTNDEAPIFIPMNTEAPIGFTDIALNPFTGKITGWDSDMASFVTFDPYTGMVEDFRAIPGMSPFNGYIAAFAFIDNQVAVGVYSPNENPLIMGFFHLNSGTLISEATGIYPPAAGYGSDACSCIDFDIACQQRLSMDTVQHCRRVIATIHIANRSVDPLPGSPFSLIDRFPEGVIVEEVLYNPYSGEENGVGSAEFSIENFVPHFGIDSIVLQLAVTDATSLGYHEIQAVISGFTDENKYPGGRLLSDNPLTYAIPLDPTSLVVTASGSTPPVSQLQYYICTDSVLWINPLSNLPDYDFTWSDGSRSAERLIAVPGQYTATVSDLCHVYPITISVDGVSLNADIGGDQSAVLGTVVSLDAQLTHDFPIVSSWWTVNDSLVLSCPEACTAFGFTLQDDAEVAFVIEDENQCKAIDRVSIRAALPLYAPNVFSPDNNGVNDFFYLQTEVPVVFTQFSIFDRWGGLVFEKKDGITNDELLGWDGSHKGAEAESGVYVWQASFFLNGQLRAMSGDVLLMR